MTQGTPQCLSDFLEQVMCDLDWSFLIDKYIYFLLACKYY